MKTPASNWNKEEIAAIKSLKKDTLIKILAADKGNATVIYNIEGSITKLIS